jgi:hypothetical protein
MHVMLQRNDPERVGRSPIEESSDAVINDPSVLLPRSAEEMSQRATDVAERLRTCFLETARQVAGPAFRPSRLVEVLGIDKSLASRISRSIRADSSYEMLHLLPSPTGLGFFLEGAARAGCPAEILKRTRQAVGELQDLLSQIAGGRPALDALMSESAVEVRERAERTASQTVYRAMSYLLGFRCETITSAIILQPSADGTMVDGLEVGRREGIRRLRPSAPVAVFSLNLATAGAPGESYMEMLGKDADPADPRSILLPEFCEPAQPALEVHKTGLHSVFALPNDDEILQGGVTISSAFFVRNGYERWRSEKNKEEFRLYLLSYPCKLLIRDLFIRDDLWVGSEPQIRLEFPAPPGAQRPEPSDPAIRLNQLDISAPVVSLGRGLRRAAAAGSSQHGRLLGNVFQQADLDPERFRGYRVRIMYPVPMITMGWWIPLPQKP